MANMIPSFILFLREGIEASLIIGILLTSLQQLGLTRYNKAVWLGVAAAVVTSLIVGGIFYELINSLVGNFLEIFKTITFLIAVVIITWMTFWVQQHSRTLKKELTEQVQQASSGFALALLAFSTVTREGIETAVFISAFSYSSDRVQLIVGGLLGTLVAVIIGILIYRFGYRLNYRIFFRVMGLLLLTMAAGLLAQSILGLQDLNILPFGFDVVWDTTGIAWLSENTSIIGSLLNVLVGYNSTPTILQVSGFALYLAIFGFLFWRLTNGPQKPKPTKDESHIPTEAIATHNTN